MDDDRYRTALLKREIERNARANGLSRSHAKDIAANATPKLVAALPVWRKIRAKVKSLAH